MKFLVDAQLPRRLARQLREAGFDALHTRNLRLANRTSDFILNEITIEEQRVLVTKDAEFVDSHTVFGRPYKLLLVSTGNIKNQDLMRLFERNLEEIVDGFSRFDFIELDRTDLIFHR